MQRGPKRLERIPKDFAYIPGIEFLTTVDQLVKLKLYLNTEDRQPYVRLGCSTPQRPSVLLRQTLKKIESLWPDMASVIGNKPLVDNEGTIETYLEKIASLDGCDDYILAARRGLERAKTAREAVTTQNSTWAVTVDNNVEIIHKPSMDPRSAHKWMRSPQRAWNLALAMG